MEREATSRFRRGSAAYDKSVRPPLRSPGRRPTLFKRLLHPRDQFPLIERLAAAVPPSPTVGMRSSAASKVVKRSAQAKTLASAADLPTLAGQARVDDLKSPYGRRKGNTWCLPNTAAAMRRRNFTHTRGIVGTVRRPRRARVDRRLVTHVIEDVRNPIGHLLCFASL